MTQTAPTGYKEFSRNGSDSVTFIRSGHTTSAPRLAIFDRKVPVANGNGFSVPQYRFRLIDGHVDAEGVPLKERSIIEVIVRHPVGIDATSITTALADASAIVGDAEFVNDALVDLMFPKEPAV